jgi:ABC-2 type transport system permease protein
MVANFDIRDIKLAVVDNNRSTYSSRFINKITSSGHFHLVDIAEGYNRALWLVEQDIVDIILEIPPRFEEDLVYEQKANVLISTNAVNGMKGGLSSAYLMSIVNDFSAEIRGEWIQSDSRLNIPKFEIVPRYNFNPLLDYKYTMIPAIMMMMLAVITGFLPALNIVGEKEKGTIEQLNVTPVSRIALILSKLIPYWIIGFVVLTICFIVAWVFYGMTSVGNYGLIYLFAAVFTLAFSGFGLMISNYAHTVQQGMFIMFFFVITFIFLSGLYTPVSSMPQWTQVVSWFSPLRYMVEVLRFIFLKGSGFFALRWHFAALCGFAVFFNGWAVLSYRKSH